MNAILLREAYAYIAAVPDTHVRLDTYRHVADDGTISGCVLGHMAMAHMFGLSLDSSGCLRCAEGEQDGEAWLVIAERLGLNLHDLISLVGIRQASEPTNISDKELVLDRFQRLFARHAVDLCSRGYYLHLEA